MSSLHLVSPDLFERPGGIARISRATALAMGSWAATNGHDFHVHVLFDGPNAQRTPHVPAHATFHGYRENRLALARAVLGACVRERTALFVFSHINLATPMLPCRGTPFAIIAHGIEVWSQLSVPRRLALRRASRVWSVSDYTGRIVRSLHGVQLERSRTLVNCIDPFWSAPAASSSSTPYFLLVSRLGNFEEQKGVGHTLQAFALAADRGWIPTSAELHVVGDGPQRHTYERDARRSGHGARIRFLGRVTDEVLQREYAQCTAFVLPSAKEGFGLVFLEAMANGKAVIAAAAGAAPEVVTNDVTGLVVPYGDVSGIAAAMARLARDETLRDTLGRRGREAVRTAFSYQAYEREVHAELDRLRAT